MQIDKDMWVRIEKAIQAICSGACKRVDVSADIKVYAVKNVIRIDIKYEE